MPIGSRYAVGFSGGPATQTRALVAAMTTAPSAARKAAIDVLIKGLISAGLWAKIDVLYMLAAADAQAARLNWKAPGTYTATENGSPTFTADRGYTGNATSMYLATAYDPSSASLGLAQDDAHAGVYAITNTTGSGRDIGSGNGLIQTRARDGTGAFITLSSSASLVATDAVTAPNHIISTRSSSATRSLYRNGLLVLSAASASTGIPNSIDILRSSADSTPLYTNRQIAAAHVGRALSAGEVTAIHALLKTYLQHAGAV